MLLAHGPHAILSALFIVVLTLALSKFSSLIVMVWSCRVGKANAARLLGKGRLTWAPTHARNAAASWRARACRPAASCRLSPAAKLAAGGTPAKEGVKQTPHARSLPHSGHRTRPSTSCRQSATERSKRRRRLMILLSCLRSVVGQ